MTFHQAKQIILQECNIKTDESSFDDMLLKLLYSKERVNEKELIFQRIEHLRSIGYNKSQTVCLLQYEFAKSRNRAYELIKESRFYE